MTARQRDYLLGVWDGLSNKEIGARLGVSEFTVRETLQALARDIGITSEYQVRRACRVQLVRWALEHGVLTVERKGEIWWRKT